MRLDVCAGQQPREEVGAADHSVELWATRDHPRRARALGTTRHVAPACREQLIVGPLADVDCLGAVLAECMALRRIAGAVEKLLKLGKDLRVRLLERTGGRKLARIPKAARHHRPIEQANGPLQRMVPYATRHSGPVDLGRSRLATHYAGSLTPAEVDLAKPLVGLGGVRAQYRQVLPPRLAQRRRVRVQVEAVCAGVQRVTCIAVARDCNKPQRHLIEYMPRCKGTAQPIDFGVERKESL
mmetsp:Transcript_17549/g.52488  ORF Transcript_17549/g.52488 Transcript_17549/m.52488 type:complete len:241 (-) Transcript_17549:229-951(-)